MPSPELTAALYPWLLPTHIGLVTASVGLFATRGLGVLAGHAWPLTTPVRRASEVIDTALLGAGATLWWLLQLNPLQPQGHWLGAKLLLLVAYIVLGSLALKRAPTRRAKTVCYVLALSVVAFMAAIAVRHHPLGGWS